MSCSEWLLSQKRACVNWKCQRSDGYYDKIHQHAASSRHPNENETCGNFGGMIAWYSYVGNMIARQTIRYEVPRGLFLFSVWGRNKIVLPVLVDGHVQERIFG